MQQSHLGETFRFRGSGDARDRAVVVDGVRCRVMLGRAKERFLLERFGSPAGGTGAAGFGLPRAVASGACPGWTIAQQLTLIQAGRRYQLVLVNLADGSQRLVWFDVTAVA